VQARKSLEHFQLGNCHEAPVTKLEQASFKCRQSSANNSASKKKIGKFSFGEIVMKRWHQTGTGTIQL
jgi:hypothetical protein